MARNRPQFEPLAVSMADAANMIGVSRSRMYELDGEGRVRTVHVGKRRLVLVSSLRELLGEAA